MSGWQIALIVAAVLLLGLVLLPAFNRWQVRRMPADQQILLIMKQAKGLHYISQCIRRQTGLSLLCKEQAQNFGLSLGAPGSCAGHYQERPL